MLDELEQATIEDTYSRRNMRQHIFKDISNLQTQIIDLANMFEIYRDREYSYRSKNERLAKIKDFEPFAASFEIISTIIPIQGKVPIQSLSGALSGYFEYEDPFDGIKTAAECIALACHLDICDIHLPRGDDGMMVSSRYSLEHETRIKLERMKYLPPMICRPMPIRNNWESGYLQQNSHRVLGSHYGQHNKPLALDVLNILNNTELCIDPRMAELEELPTKPLDTPEKEYNFNLMRDTSREVYEELDGKGFFFDHGYDCRGRFYAAGYHINYQGSKYKRALLDFENKEVIT